MLARTHGDWLDAVESNMLVPIFLIKALLPGIRARRFGRIVNISSARVKRLTERMGLSASARVGLTALCMGELALDGVAVPALFVEPVGGHAAESMAGQLTRRVSQGAHGGGVGVLTHRAAINTRTGEHVPPASGKRLQLAYDFYRLGG